MASNAKIVEVTGLKLQGEGTFTGLVHADTLVPHGLGRMEYFSAANGTEQEEVKSYEGEWDWGQWHGSDGVLQFRNGDSYIGAFSQNARHGPGLYLWADGRCYEGDFQHNQRHGQGTFTFSDGAVYHGGFVKGRRQGQGTYRFPNGNSYEGEWVAGEYEGYGVFAWNDGRVYRGEWKKSKHHGHGVELDEFGKVVYNGIWVDNKRSAVAHSANEREPMCHTPAYPHEIVISSNSTINDDCSELGMSVVEASEQPLPLRRLVTPPSEYSYSQPAREMTPPLVLDSDFDLRPRKNSVNRGPNRTQESHQFALKATGQQQPRARPYSASTERPVTIGQHHKRISRGEEPALASFESLPQISALMQDQREALTKCNASHRRQDEHQHKSQRLNYVDAINFPEFR